MSFSRVAQAVVVLASVSSLGFASAVRINFSSSSSQSQAQSQMATVSSPDEVTVANAMQKAEEALKGTLAAAADVKKAVAANL